MSAFTIKHNVFNFSISAASAVNHVSCSASSSPFCTLSKIQKGGEPVPQAGEERCRSANKWIWHLDMSACVLCLVHVSVCTVCHLVKTSYTYCPNGLQSCPFVLFEVGRTLIKSKRINKVKKRVWCKNNPVLMLCYENLSRYRVLITGSFVSFPSALQSHALCLSEFCDTSNQRSSFYRTVSLLTSLSDYRF